MSTRETLSRLALPLIGAAAVTAGAVLVQITRKPVVDTAMTDPASRAPAPATIQPERADLAAHTTGSADAGSLDASILQRLRERGL